MSAPRFVVVDDHPLCREATKMALGVVSAETPVCCAGSLAEVRKVLTGPVALLVLDLGLPDANGVSGVLALLDDDPSLKIFILTASDEADMERAALRAGCVGFLSKGAPIRTLIAALASVLDGQFWFSDAALAAADQASDHDRIASLTQAQQRVLDAMTSGRLNKQIAHDLGISEATVKAHVQAILAKLNVPNRTQAVLMSNRYGQRRRA